MTSSIIPHRRKAFQPAGGAYVGVQPDIGIIMNDGSGTAVAVTEPSGTSDQTAEADRWQTSPTRYDCNATDGIYSTDGEFSSVLDSLTDQLTIFIRATFIGSWNFTQKYLVGYGNGVGTDQCFGFNLDRNHTTGIVRLVFRHRISGVTSNTQVEVDYGESAQSGEHSCAMVYDGTDVQFYYDGAAHGSAASLTGSLDLPTVERLGWGGAPAGVGTSLNWDDGIRDGRIALTALSGAEISTWNDNPAT